MTPHPPDAPSAAVLAECREFLLDKLASVGRNAGLRDGAVIGELRKATGEHFDDLVRGGGSGFAQAGNLTASKIRLVDDDQLEFAIALTELSAELAELCGSQLSRLQLRMMTLVGTDRYDASANPVGPETVCAGIDAACAEHGGSLKDLLALLGRFRTNLLVELPAMYMALDELLVRRRVVPRALPRGAAEGAARARDLSSRGAAVDGDAFAALQGTLLARSGGRAAAAPGERAGVTLDPAIAAMLLERALGELDAAQRARTAAGEGSRGNVLQTMKTAGLAPQLDAAGGASLDALALVFDEIFDSPRLPDAIKAILGRMQIPLLKASLLDPTFLDNPAHPARRLLDSMAAAATCVPQGVAGEHPVCAELRSAANVVQTEFERDLGVFERVGADLDRFLDSRKAAALAAAQPYLPLAAQADQREAARAGARRALAAIGHANLPDVLCRFLDTEWVDVLAVVAQRHGEGSVQWNDLCDVARGLVWSVEPKQAAEDRQRLLALLPRLLGRMNAGLDLIGLPSDRRGPLLDAFVALHSSALRGKAGAATGASGPEAAQDKAVEDASAAGSVRAETIEDEQGLRITVLSTVSAPEDAQPSSVPLQLFDWLQFRLPDASAQCGCVAWRGPQSDAVLVCGDGASPAFVISSALLGNWLRTGRAAVGGGSVMEAAAARALRLVG